MRAAPSVRGPCVACIVVLTAVACDRWQAPEEITVKRINIVDESGHVMFIIAGDLPGPVVRGQRLERDIVPAGIVWHDRNGDESGGLAIAPVTGWKGRPGNGRVRMLTFDFNHQITDAVRLDTFESDDGESWSGGLTVFDRRPYEAGPVTSSQGKERIYLGTQNGDAGLSIRDSQERERIRIGVRRDGVAVIEILGEDGQVLHRVPE